MGRKKTDRLTRRKIGEALRAERQAQGITRDELAETLDCAASYLKRVEEGECGLSLGTLVEWSRSIGVEAHLILRDAGV